MKAIHLSGSLSMKLAPSQRRAVELLAKKQKISLGEAARELLDAGIHARGIACRK
jgi:hypothetical protein